MSLRQRPEGRPGHPHGVGAAGDQRAAGPSHRQVPACRQAWRAGRGGARLMVDTTLPRDRQATRMTYVVQRLTDRDEIRALLAPERAYAAYALAHLEPDLFELSEWYTATGPQGRAPSTLRPFDFAQGRLRSGQAGSPSETSESARRTGQAPVAHSWSGLGRALFALGDPQALDVIL